MYGEKACSAPMEEEVKEEEEEEEEEVMKLTYNSSSLFMTFSHTHVDLVGHMAGPDRTNKSRTGLVGHVISSSYIKKLKVLCYRMQTHE